MRFLLGRLVTIGFACVPTALLACSPPTDDFVPHTVTSPIPAREAPNGAVQLKVATPKTARPENGRISLDVREIIDGDFDQNSIRLNVTNVDGCNSYFNVTPSVESYITVLPLKYRDGEAIRDDQGRAEFGALFYRDYDSGFLLGESRPEFAAYSERMQFSFFDFARADCLMQENSGVAGWRKCVAPGEYVFIDCANNNLGALVCEESDVWGERPTDLRRGYSFWTEWRSKVPAALACFVVAVGLGYLFFRRRRATYDLP
ncbi:MAG: hypothetical protein AAGL68_02600 [Pseudomonadota bacterium]